MAQKHLQLLRNTTVFANYQAAYNALTAMTGYADGTPILARYTDAEDHQQTLLGVVNGQTIDVINNVSEYLLRNYVAYTGDTTTVAATDDINTAIAKLEKHILDIAQDVTVNVVADTAETTSHYLTVTPNPTSTGDTFTLTLDDVASATALTAEIAARKAVDGQNGDTYAANSGTRYISGATSLNDADIKLDAALSALSDSFDDTISNLDYADTAVTGQYVSEVDEADGVISVQRANVSEAPLNNYVPVGTGDTDVAATDTINEAINKIENKIAASSAAAATEVVEGTDAGNNMTIGSATDPTDGHMVYTINLADVASASALTQEISDREDGDEELSNRLGTGVTTANTATAQFAELTGMIEDLDLAVVSGVGEVITAVSQEDGQVAASKTAVKDVTLTGYAKETGSTGAISASDDIETALSKLENNIEAAQSATTVSNDDGSINVTTATTGTTINVNIKTGEKVLAKAGNAGLYTDLDFVKITTGLPETVKERYQLLATDDSQIGVNIDVPKDSHIVSINYITTGEHAQNLEYVYIDVSGNTQTTYVDMSELVLETEFASGVTVTDHIAHGVVDPQSETFLTVGANGFKLSGVQDAIDEASAAAATEVAEGSDAGNNMSIVKTTGASGQSIYTINLTDVASASALTDEISARKAVDGVNGNAYTADTNAHYINNVGNLYAADQALDTALYNEVTARTAAIEALDATVSTSGSQYITGFQQVDGQITGVTKANIPDVELVGYTKGTDSSAVSSDDSINEAIAKLENQIENSSAAAATEIVEGTDDGDNMDIVKTTGASGQSIYTINLTDVASASALTDEIAARKAVDGQNGDTYAANSSARYISGATSLNDADVKLDAALDAVEDALDTLEGIAITAITSSNTGCTVTVSGTGNTRNIAVNTDGGQVQLTGYDNTVTGTPVATDSVNAAIAKLYNMVDAGQVEAGSATTVEASSTGQIVDVKLDTTSNINEYDATHAQHVDNTSKNVLEITSNGLYLNNNWDCGTY